MCETCVGSDQLDHDDAGHGHFHERGHAPGADHGSVMIRLDQDFLAKNDRLAAQNRDWLLGRSVLGLNLVSSPGAGKTTLLERTIQDVGGMLPIHVIEGDQATSRDAERIRTTGNTGKVCHLDADMVARALTQLDPPSGSTVMIENVGNLVCSALFDLGEHAKVVITSVAEGDDKPIKYPHMFRASEVMILNKIDLLPHVGFDVERCLAFARDISPRLQVFQVSATRGDGLESWYGWLADRLIALRSPLHEVHAAG
jgi:hydrogenase nickel incorporation protein HypB